MPEKIKGFTLIEIAIVVGIVALMAVALVPFGRPARNTVYVENKAFEIAQAVREARSYASGVRGANGDFTAGYGANFSLGSAKTYAVFADKDGDQRFDNGEEVEIVELGGDVVIARICGTEDDGSVGCSDTGPLWGLNVLFLRPAFDAVLIGVNNGGNEVYGPYKDASIFITSAGGAEREIFITKAGQISVR